ncbi:MAG: 5'/3'-nucleotidase SurE [Lentisphaerae bacterium]|nr:5'/3'-nucleotidase SurE [Lentisphaerota bacterium]
MTVPLIFVTNDDGIESPGIRAAVAAVCSLGEVLVVAPRRQQSSTGRGIGGGKDERLTRMDFDLDGRHVRAYACDATPAQTLLHGLNVLGAGRRPDLIVSGINYGENLGTNITLSGTVGAAIEGASAGIRALAVALQTDTAFHHHYGDVDWATATHFTRLFAARLLALPALPHDVDVLNVVVPESATTITPWRVTRQSRHPYFSAQLANGGLDSRIGDARIGVFCDRGAVEADSDIAAILCDGLVSVTPLSLDCTSRTDFGVLDRHLRAL